MTVQQLLRELKNVRPNAQVRIFTFQSKQSEAISHTNIISTKFAPEKQTFYIVGKREENGN